MTARAKTLLALALLMPLAACAAQPAAADSAALAQAPAAAGQQEERVQDRTTAPAVAAPARPGTADSARGVPATTATIDPAPAAAPDTAPDTAPDAAGMPRAPAAVPGTPANPVPAPLAASGPSAGSLLQTILALALVLALLAALAWAMKRYGPKMSGGSANLRMVGALNIGGRERILVVEVGDQWIVVGASPGRVNALATMPKGEGLAGTQGAAALAGHAPPGATFADWLKQTIDKRNAK